MSDAPAYLDVATMSEPAFEALPANPPEIPERSRRRAPRPAPAADRLPPHAPEAERGILGCILLDPAEALNGVREALGAVVLPDPAPDEAKPWKRPEPIGMESACYDTRHQVLLRCMLEMDAAGRPIDLVTVSQRLKDLGQLEDAGGIAYLGELTADVPSAANVGYYAALVVEKWRLRLTLQACADTIQRVHEGGGEVDDIVRGLQGTVLTLSEQRSANRLAHVKVGVKEVLEVAEKSFIHRNQGIVAEFPTGLSYLDKKITGLHRREVFYLGGVQSSGKTSMALTMMAHQVVKCGIPVGFLSIESKRPEIVLRLMCNLSGASYRQIHSGMISAGDFSKLHAASSTLAKAPLWVDDTNGMSPLDVRMIARRMVQQHGIKVLYIDHLHRMVVPEARGDDRLAIKLSVQAIRWCAAELDLAVVCLAQLNRESKKETRGGRGSRRAEATDFRGAAEIEEDADVAGILQPDPENDDDCQPEAETWPVCLHIVKQRNGTQGPVKLTFQRHLYRFEDRYFGRGSVSEAEAKKARMQSQPQQETWEDSQ